MKRLLLLFILFALPAFGQGVRFGDSDQIIAGQIPGGPLYSVPNAVINFCNSPNVNVPCANKITTYTDATLTTPCSTSTQVVLAGTNSCVGTTDGYGNWGVWVPSGTYTWTVTVPGGATLGPFTATLAAGGSSSSLSINGFPVTNPNLNAVLPTADASFLACSAKVGGSNFIVECPSGTTGSTFLLGNGNAATASALAATPTNCGSNTASTGISANGNAIGCFTPAGTPSGASTALQFNNSGVFGGVNPPSTPNLPYTLTETPSGGVAQTPVWELPGLGSRNVTGTTSTDTVLASDCDPITRVGYTGSVNVAVTLPTATTLAVPNCSFRIANDTNPAQTVTVTPTTWTISSNGSTGLTSLAITQGQVATFVVDAAGSIWDVDGGGSGGACGSGTFAAHTFCGNNTGSTASPVASGIGSQDYSPNYYAAGAGTANAQTVTLPIPITSLVPNLDVCWLPVATNTSTAVTLNVNATGVDSVFKSTGTSTGVLSIGDINLNVPACVKYLASNAWLLTNPQTAVNGSTSLSSVTGATTQATGTEAGATANYTFAGVETGNGHFPFAFTNANGSAGQTGALFVGNSGAGGAQYGLAIDGTAQTPLSIYTGGSFSAGVWTLGSFVMQLTSSGNLTTSGNLTLGATPTISSTSGALTLNAGASSGNINLRPGTSGTGTTQVTASGNSAVALTVKGLSSQTGDLQDWNSSTPTVLAKVDSAGNITAPTYNTGSNCSSSASPAVCGTAAAGNVVIAAGATTVVVDTSAVDSNSQIFIQSDESLGTKLGVTCNTTFASEAGPFVVTARTPSTSFTITTTATITTNPDCLSYYIVN